MSTIIPNIIVVVPYRDRPHQVRLFTTHMPFILEPYLRENKNVTILFSHQVDKRSFNRGAMKNIGYLWALNEFGEEITKNITFVFHDLDTMPAFPEQLNYDLDDILEDRPYCEYRTDIIKHYYGFTFALGGILSMKGETFKKIGGYPNIWGWGFEDNCLACKCDLFNITVDRSTFYDIGDEGIFNCVGGSTRRITNQQYEYTSYITKDCIVDIKDLSYNNEYESSLFNNDIISLINERNRDKGGILSVLFVNAINWNTSNPHADEFESTVKLANTMSIKSAQKRDFQRMITMKEEMKKIKRANPFYRELENSEKMLEKKAKEKNAGLSLAKSSFTPLEQPFIKDAHLSESQRAENRKMQRKKIETKEKEKREIVKSNRAVISLMPSTSRGIKKGRLQKIKL